MKVVPEDKNELQLTVLSVEAILQAGEELCLSNPGTNTDILLGLFRAGNWLINPVIEFIYEGNT